MKQFTEHLGVVNVSSGDNYRMNEFICAIHTDMRFGAKIPLIPLLGLMHLRIARFLFVLGGTWSRDDRGIDDRAPTDRHATAGKTAVHLGKQLLTKFVLLEKPPKFTERGFVGSSLTTQIDLRKTPHRDAFVE